jgi:hypothetical protein
MRSCLFLLAACLATPAWSATVVEGTDFSGSGAAPSSFVLDAGENSLTGAVGFLSPGVLDLDYVALTVPAGFRLDSMIVGPSTSVGGAVSFIGVQAGPVMTVSPTAGSAAGLLGWAHYGSGDIGRDLLPVMGGSAGALGFGGPLEAGTYTFWVQDFSDLHVPYQFVMQVSAVPDLPALPLLVAGLGTLFASRRRA